VSKKGFFGHNGFGAADTDIETFRIMPLEQQRKIIEEGMETIVLERIAKELLDVPLQTLLNRLDLPPSTIQRRLKTEQPLSPSESDKVARVLYVWHAAKKTFCDGASAAEWIKRPNAKLNHLAPLDLLGSHVGYDRVQSILARFAAGVTA